MGKIHRNLKNKFIFGFYQSENKLEFIYDHLGLKVKFTGFVKENVLLKTNDLGLVKAVKEYLYNKNFAFLKEDSQLVFGNLKLKYDKNQEEVVFFTREYLQSEYYYDKEIYYHNINDLVLWTIVNADKKFSIEKERIKRELVH